VQFRYRSAGLSNGNTQLLSLKHIEVDVYLLIRYDEIKRAEKLSVYGWSD